MRLTYEATEHRLLKLTVASLLCEYALAARKTESAEETYQLITATADHILILINGPSSCNFPHNSC